MPRVALLNLAVRGRGVLPVVLRAMWTSSNPSSNHGASGSGRCRAAARCRAASGPGWRPHSGLTHRGRDQGAVAGARAPPGLAAPTRAAPPPVLADQVRPVGRLWSTTTAAPPLCTNSWCCGLAVATTVAPSARAICTAQVAQAARRGRDHHAVPGAYAEDARSSPERHRSPVYQRPGRLLCEVWVVIGRAVLLEALPNAVDRGRHRHEGKRRHGCRQGPILGDV